MHKHDHYSRIRSTDLVMGRDNLQFIMVVIIDIVVIAIGFIERCCPCLADPACQLSIPLGIFGLKTSSHMFGS